MSQSKTTCPICERPPGGIHEHECPRSRFSQVLLRKTLDQPPRLIWTKGIMIFHDRRTGRTRTVRNPGVPFVLPPKPWFAGGIPGKQPGSPDLPDNVQAFIDDLAELVQAAKESHA